MKNGILSKRDIIKSTLFVVGFWTITAFMFYGIYKIIEFVPMVLTNLTH